MGEHRGDPWQWRDEIVQAHGAGRHDTSHHSDRGPSAGPLPRTSLVPLAEVAGRVLAAPLTSPEALPAQDLSAMDGFAVRRAELTAPGATVLPVVADLPARPGHPAPLPPGTAARIMTGAPLPPGADAVVPVEDTDADPAGPVPAAVRITLASPLPPRKHVRGPGEEVTRGEELAPAGTRVGAALIGLAAALGVTDLEVHAPPRVGIVVTGDELTGAGPAVPGTVRESDGTMLAAALVTHGAIPRVLRGPDDPARLRAVLADAARDADLVVTTGGIGHGAYDVVKSLLGPGGDGTSRFAHLALRPGGPQGHGTLPPADGADHGTPVVHLPGTPVGALVGYHLFVRPLLPGPASAPRRVLVGEGSFAVRRPGLTVVAGRLRRGADGGESVDTLPGRRLAPYGRADALVLLDGSLPATAAPGESVLVLDL
ncbi:molybdopterin molybdenumtransferase MoeA [Brachybacterium sp. SGAir0954]|uniref:molybdopterin molybdotransferase MoeA n=1 Tax=Brachybacterium sp. SGAir0954 TaxID=2571029 RepID=UPI0010CD020C|nr:molybdopterin molybdotransferase MoeA [Brachybacterium sp. SGAir0954]QCR54698.1 molybdopterin molybdenumtransferase MoeA [Brachybacterium sp. SGAir0954]